MVDAFLAWYLTVYPYSHTCVHAPARESSVGTTAQSANDADDVDAFRKRTKATPRRERPSPSRDYDDGGGGGGGTATSATRRGFVVVGEGQTGRGAVAV